MTALIARLTDSQPIAEVTVPLLRRICAWHDTFDPTAASNKGATHTICADCQRRVDADMGRAHRASRLA
jgi:hypothetical protein